MAGKIIEVKVKVGDSVQEDDELFTLEAMKMEMPIVATSGGTVKEIKVEAGQAVEGDQVLAVLD
jgi:biotin carboxyl carrier protein